MHTFTALYDQRDAAEAAQRRLQELGVLDADGNAVAGRERFESQASGEAKSFWESRGGVAPPEPDRRLYEEGVKRGGFLLTVDVDEDRAGEVHRLLDGSGAVDVEERERELRGAGVLPPATETASTETMRTQPLPSHTAPPTGAAPTSLSVGQEERIPIAEERLVVGKRSVERGGARVRSYVVEQPVHEQVRLREEHVDIERRPVGRPLDAGADAFQERRFEVRETAEEAVVGKEARVTEELVVRKDQSERTEEIDDVVRHTEVDVESPEPPRRTS